MKNIYNIKTLKTHLFLIVLFVFTISSCKKDSVEETPKLFTKSNLSGHSQKGPFVNGSSLTLFELDNNFTQTGKVFNTQISDNTGIFQLPNLTLSTSYVKLKADGFYFNEVANNVSQAQLTLYALSDLTSLSTVNVNLMTTLEVARIEYLLGTDMSFAAAKAQAQSEVMNIFSISMPSIPESEVLDISQSGDDNAILLGISLILQGYRTEAQLTQLLGDISSDIRTDGVLNNQQAGTALLNGVYHMNLPEIRSHIENKYQSLGVSATIPDFEKYIHQFIDSTTYTYTNYDLYPYTVLGKVNLLYDSSFAVISGIQYALGAKLPLGTSVKLVVKPSAGYSWVSGNVGVYALQNQGWTEDNYYPDSLVFNAVGSGLTVYIPIQFITTHSDIIMYENGLSTPSRTIVIAN